MASLVTLDEFCPLATLSQLTPGNCPPGHNRSLLEQGDAEDRGDDVEAALPVAVAGVAVLHLGGAV